MSRRRGTWGALNHAYQGFVDIRLTMLPYLGSLVGTHVGACGVKVVKERMIRIVTGTIIIFCNVIEAYRQRRRIQTTLVELREVEEAA